MTEKKEMSIVLTNDEVRRILDRGETILYRPIKPQPPEDAGPIHVSWYHPTVVDVEGVEQPGSIAYGAWDDNGVWGTPCPSGAIGDYVWVRETLAAVDNP